MLKNNNIITLKKLDYLPSELPMKQLIFDHFVFRLKQYPRQVQDFQWFEHSPRNIHQFRRVGQCAKVHDHLRLKQQENVLYQDVECKQESVQFRWVQPKKILLFKICLFGDRSKIYLNISNFHII